MKRIGPLVVLTACALFEGRAEAQDENRDAPSSDSGLRWELAGGGAYRTLFGLDMWGGDVTARAGIQSHGAHSAVFGEGSYFRGSTAAGLTTDVISGGFRAALMPIARFHFGGGAHIVYFDIGRATEGGSISTWGIGCSVFFGYDVFEWPIGNGPFDVFVEVRADAMSLDTFHNAATMWGPTMELGVRL